jgi:peptidoglycan hydrolase CwlO-like protein
MKSIHIICFLLFFITAQAQIKIQPSFNNQGNYTLKKLHKYDSVVVLCDTVYLVNKPLFLVYAALYSKQKNIQQVLNESNEISQNHISEQDIQYEKLNSEFQLTIDKFKKYQENSRQNLDSLQTGLKGAEENLAKARKENEKLKEQIGKAMHQNNSQKYYLGLAGVTIGLIIAILIR